MVLVLVLNPPTGGTFFTVGWDFAKLINFSDLNRSAVARALGRARAVELSMARGGGGNRTYDANCEVLAHLYCRFAI